MEEKCYTKYKVLVGNKTAITFPDIYYVNDKKAAIKLLKKFQSKTVSAIIVKCGK